MSFRPDKLLNQTGIDFSEHSSIETNELFGEVFARGIYGICFSLYIDGQTPGDQISEGQVQQRMEVLQPHAKWIRSFSCIDGNEHIPKAAHSSGMKTLVGAWIGDDPELNEMEVNGLIALAQAGHVDIAAVGNEVIFRSRSCYDIF